LIRPGQKRHRFDPPPEVGYAPSRSFGAVFRYPTLLGHSRPGRSGGSLSLTRSAALVGFVLTRLHLRRVDPAWRAEPAFPPFRAHVPFAPPRPPRLIFVGVTRPFARGRSETLASVSRRAKDGSGLWWRSTSGLRSRLRSGPPMRFGPFTERRVDGPILPWAFGPLSGLSGTVFTCNRVGSTPRGSPASGRLTSHAQLGGGPTHPLVGVTDASSPIVQSPAERPPAAIECSTRPAGRSRVRPALQRIRGADAWSSVARATHPRGATPCLRFCTVREHPSEMSFANYEIHGEVRQPI
jgi:hypothetical protein